LIKSFAGYGRLKLRSFTPIITNRLSALVTAYATAARTNLRASLKTRLTILPDSCRERRERGEVKKTKVLEMPLMGNEFVKALENSKFVPDGLNSPKVFIVYCRIKRRFAAQRKETGSAIGNS